MFSKKLFLQVTVEGVVIFKLKTYQLFSAVSFLDDRRYCS